MAQSIFDIFTPKPSNKPKTDKVPVGLYAAIDDVGYRLEKNNWYTSKPYGFKLTDKDGKEWTMFLPISPNNLTITTNFATNIIPTIYGTVEEHSPVRYYDITIEGTTGMAPKYVDPVDAAQIPEAKTGRSIFSVQQTIRPNALGGFFSKTINTINNVVESTKALLSPTPEVKTGLYVDQTGYAAFHNLYRFLLKYKKDSSSANADGKDRPHPLVFFNYKDANQYNVVVRSFTLRRDKEDPMLYYYSISMRGYNLSSINKNLGSIANKEQKDMLADLGLDGVEGSSYLGKAKEFATNAKGILGSVAAGINQFGR